MAAVLSECRAVIPEQLFEALATEPLDISASLLISRAEIPDVMLLGIMERCGADHAKVIALRNGISEAARQRIDALIESIAPVTTVEVTPETKPDAPADAVAALADEAASEGGLKIETTRNALRRLMMRQTVRADFGARMVLKDDDSTNLVVRLINLALTGEPDFLATALADEMRLGFAAVRRAILRNDTRQLMLLLKGMELGATDTFAILAAFRPHAMATPEAVAAFYVAYQAASDEDIAALTGTLTAETARPLSASA